LFRTIVIDYAVLEDRLRSYLYYMVALKDRKSFKINNRNNIKGLRDIVLNYKDPHESNGLWISSITEKRKIVKSILRWSLRPGKVNRKGDNYLCVTYGQCQKTNIKGTLDCIKRIEDWCKYRNEITHALMTKNVSSVDKEIKSKAEEGLELARYLDTELNKLKKYNRIRRRMGLREEKW